MIRAQTLPADITEIIGQLDELLDESIDAEGYIIRKQVTTPDWVDLAQIDFEALKEEFAKERSLMQSQIRLRCLLIPVG